MVLEPTRRGGEVLDVFRQFTGGGGRQASNSFVRREIALQRRVFSSQRVSRPLSKAQTSSAARPPPIVRNLVGLALVIRMPPSKPFRVMYSICEWDE